MTKDAAKKIKLNDRQKIIELAKIDGLLLPHQKVYNCYKGDYLSSGIGAFEGGQCKKDFPDYLRFYDAILPLIKKQTEEVQAATNANMQNGDYVWLSTPEQLADSLLKSKGF